MDEKTRALVAAQLAAAVIQAGQGEKTADNAVRTFRAISDKLAAGAPQPSTSGDLKKPLKHRDVPA